jgi:hypothetical protein
MRRPLAARSCARCMATYVPSYRDQRFCGKACANARLVVEHRFRCGWCGEEYVAKERSRRSYCSRAHAFAAQKAAGAAHKEARRDIVLALALLLPPIKKQPRAMVGCTCVICGADFDVSLRRKHCSRPCELEAGRRRERMTREARQPRRITCGWCGSDFEVRLHRQRKYCSKRCTANAARDVRRARLRGASGGEVISLATLIRRDGGRCHLCGEAVVRDPEHRHPLGPTRDHLVPVSQGGAHVWANIRLAHRICNSFRGVKPVAA